MDQGKIYVTKILYNKGKIFYPDPPEGSTKIIVMMKSHCPKWFPLSPYSLKTEEGYLFENYWQFSKVYEVVPQSKEYYSRYDKTVIWEWEEERHCSRKNNDEEWEILPDYFNWRKEGFHNKYPVRYPVGFHHKSKVLFSLSDEGERLNYVEARKKIYLENYSRIVKKEKRYQELRKRISEGESISIYEVDGPHQESLEYYKNKYNVKDDFIVEHSILVTHKNIEIMMEDTKHSFGHGYCLGLTLLDDL